MKDGAYDYPDLWFAEIDSLPAVPEPSTMILLGSGLAILLGLRKKLSGLAILFGLRKK